MKIKSKTQDKKYHYPLYQDGLELVKNLSLLAQLISHYSDISEFHLRIIQILIPHQVYLYLARLLSLLEKRMNNLVGQTGNIRVDSQLLTQTLQQSLMKRATMEQKRDQMMYNKDYIVIQIQVQTTHIKHGHHL